MTACGSTRTSPSGSWGKSTGRSPALVTRGHPQKEKQDRGLTLTPTLAGDSPTHSVHAVTGSAQVKAQTARQHVTHSIRPGFQFLSPASHLHT